MMGSKFFRSFIFKAAFIFILSVLDFGFGSFVFAGDGFLVCTSEQNQVSRFIQKIVSGAIRGVPQGYSKVVADVILLESTRYGFDPILLVALIQNESRFSAKLRGTHGEIGLMQIKPTTARWVSQEMGLPWLGAQALTDPVFNIRMGVAYLAKMSQQFKDNPRLYLSAYNMGPFNVQKNLRRNLSPLAYASRVANHYVHFYTDFLETCNIQEKKQLLIAARDSLTVL